MSGSDVVAGALGALAGVAATYAALRPRSPGSQNTAPSDAAPPPQSRSRAEVAALLDVLPFAAFTLGADRRVRVFNRAAAAMFGVDAQRVAGRALIEVVPSVELERLAEASLQGETHTRDIVFGSGARERWFGVSVQPYEDGAIAIAADRTGYLAGERVRRDFTGNVSHELRTPLSAIKLMLETVMISDDDAEARRIFLPQIATEVERMIQIVEDLLELARSESGIVPLRRERIDLRELARECANGFAQRAAAAGIELRVEDGGPVPADADPGRLMQVAVNLLDNAVRHTPEGGRVTLAAMRERGAAVLRVSDTGAGIPYADLPRIFERFYVVDRSRSRERGGTGLGLAIAKHLVEGHGGTLTADSVYGQGASFTVRIPSKNVEA